MTDPDPPTSPSSSASHVTERFWAGALRILIAAFCVVVLPWVIPSAAEYRWVLWAYLAGTILFQIAIARDIGGQVRALMGAALDIAMTTFVVHRLGSTSTPFAAAYCLLATFYALVTPTAVAVTVSVLGAASYAAVCFADALGVSTFAPDFREMALPPPTLATATASVVVLSAFVFTSFVASHRVALTLRRRENELRESEQRLRDANLQLEKLSHHDPLTHLFNRRHFVIRLEEELGRVRRGSQMALLMIDLDGFKRVNDEAGHLTGDELLRRIASAMSSATRQADVVGRFGGDEFVVILVDADGEHASRAATRLRAAVAQASSGMGLSVTASIGVAVARPDHDVASLIAEADAAAYDAKRRGGDRWAFSVEGAARRGPL
jgi:diguanylate cyclase (GGDEF)-like protein